MAQRGPVVVARIGKAHGLKGEVSVEIRTDDPGGRLVPGAVFDTDPAYAGPLTLRSVRDHNGVLLLGFEAVLDRTGAERLRGLRLMVEDGTHDDGTPDDGTHDDGTPDDGTPDDRTPDDRTHGAGRPADDGWYEADLVGLRAETVGGQILGEVVALEVRPVQDLLVLGLTAGGQARVPFVEALVPTVDVSGGRVVLDLPKGLLELGLG